MITVLVMTDGRKECLEQTMQGLSKLTKYDNILINDDSADPFYAAWLAQTYGSTNVTIQSSNERSGFGGAIQNAWRTLRKWKPDFVFHLEDDFVLTREVDTFAMIRVLNRNPQIVQMALRRQPWNDIEKAAGGIVESNPDAYVDVRDGKLEWLEHRLFFTTNPSLYRGELVERTWPNEKHSEGKFSIQLFGENTQNVSAFWGGRRSGEWVNHIGQERVGTGY